MEKLRHLIQLASLLALSALLLGGCSREKTKNIQLARTTFESIYKGERAIEDSIDWDTFRFNNEDLGASYRQIPGSFDKAEFRRYTMSKIAADFKSRGWSPDKVRNWRTNQSASFRVIITADAPTGSVFVTITITPIGRKLVSAIETKS